MLLRKNTKAFKTIKEIFSRCKDKADRKDLIRLYITKAGHSIEDRISVEALQGDAELFYNINYDAIRNNLESSDRHLHESESEPGIYFFQTNSNKMWDETPFEFDEAVKKEFSSLGDLPVVRKKGRVTKYILPVAKAESKSTSKKKSTPKEKPAEAKKVNVQPNYGLKHKIEFTNLNELLFREAKVSKKDVLDYYHKISGYILPYLKDRPIAIRPADGDTDVLTIDELAEIVQTPQWVQKSSRTANRQLLCNDKEHLLWYVEIGCLEFRCSPSRLKSPDYTDYSLISIYRDDGDHDDLIRGCIAVKKIIEGLKLQCFVTTGDGPGVLLRFALDSNCTFETSKRFAVNICKLIRLTEPRLIGIDELDTDNVSKILLSIKDNKPEKFQIAPYSLIAGEVPIVASPINWEQIDQGSNAEGFTIQNVLKTLVKNADPFATLLKKKINVTERLKMLESNYFFLF